MIPQHLMVWPQWSKAWQTMSIFCGIYFITCLVFFFLDFNVASFHVAVFNHLFTVPLLVLVMACHLQKTSKSTGLYDYYTSLIYMTKTLRAELMLFLLTSYTIPHRTIFSSSWLKIRFLSANALQSFMGNLIDMPTNCKANRHWFRIRKQDI